MPKRSSMQSSCCQTASSERLLIIADIFFIYHLLDQLMKIQSIQVERHSEHDISSWRGFWLKGTVLLAWELHIADSVPRSSWMVMCIPKRQRYREWQKGWKGNSERRVKLYKLPDRLRNNAKRRQLTSVVNNSLLLSKENVDGFLGGAG